MFLTFFKQFYIRDTKSSSGTFVNRARLSQPNQESKPFLLHHGDVIQLGVDYQGGIEGILSLLKSFIFWSSLFEN